MMLFMLIVTSGQLLVRSIIEEKSNRIVEVLVSSVSSTEIDGRKVLGLSGLGFTQIAFWALIGTAASLEFGIGFVALDNALLLIVYFILGYLFYAAIFIGVGSPLTTEQEAQQVTSYLVILLIVPIILAMPAMKDPGAMWLKILTFIPFLTPTMMALRIPIQMPAAWKSLRPSRSCWSPFPLRWWRPAVSSASASSPPAKVRRLPISFVGPERVDHDTPATFHSPSPPHGSCVHGARQAVLPRKATMGESATTCLARLAGARQPVLVSASAITFRDHGVTRLTGSHQSG